LRSAEDGVGRRFLCLQHHDGSERLQIHKPSQRPAVRYRHVQIFEPVAQQGAGFLRGFAYHRPEPRFRHKGVSASADAGGFALPHKIVYVPDYRFAGRFPVRRLDKRGYIINGAILPIESL
jgi:hypothetical protein